MAKLHISTETWPVVIFTVQGEVDRENVDKVVSVFKESCARGGRHINVFDLMQMSGMPATARQRFMEDSQQHEDLYRRHVIAAVSIMSSPLVRGLLTAMQWVAPFSTTLYPFPDATAAVARVEELLRKEGIPVPQGLAGAAWRRAG